MSFQLFGLPVSRGIAIGRAVLVASSRLDVAHYYVAGADVEAEIERLRSARDAVAGELAAMQRDLPIEAPAELSALLDVHLMLLHDDTLTGAAKHWTASAITTPSVGAARGAGAAVRRDGGRDRAERG
jgi:phosphotransferase system enzyme I (PtsI)